MAQTKETRFYKALGSAIRSGRKANGMSQKKLADSLGLTRTSVVNIEAGRQRTPSFMLVRIARELNCGAWELVRVAEC